MKRVEVFLWQLHGVCRPARPPNVARQTAGQVLTAIVDFDELLLAFKAVAHGGIIARRRRLRWAAFSLRRAGLSDPRFEVSLYASAMNAVPIVSSMPTTIPNRRFMAASSCPRLIAFKRSSAS